MPRPGGTEQASRRALCRRLGCEPASNIRAFRLGNKNCAKSRNMDRTPAASLVWPACRSSLAAPVAAFREPKINWPRDGRFCLACDWHGQTFSDTALSNHTSETEIHLSNSPHDLVRAGLWR